MLRAMNTGNTLSHRWARTVQVAWIVAAIFCLAFFIIEIQLAYQPSLPSSNYLTALRTFYMVVHLFIAGFIIFKRPNETFTVFVAYFLLLMGTTFWTLSSNILDQPVFWQTPRAFANVTTSSALLIFFLIFPDGRFYPRWTILFAISMIFFLVTQNFFPQSMVNPKNWGWAFTTGLSLFTVIVMIYVPMYRYRSLTDPVTRQQTKWVVYGIASAILLYFLIALPVGLNTPSEDSTLYGLLFVTGITLAFILIPLSITVAVMRFRLWDIDPIINRTLVYGALSFLTIFFYALTVGGFAYLIGNTQSNIIVSFIATGVIAILFEPLRQRLQLGVNRLMYGERDDPTSVLTRLSQRLDTALAPDSVLQTIVETLAQTLKLPYTAISLLDEKPRFVSSPSLPPSELHRLPLTHQTELVGELTLAPRAAGESFSPVDMKLIHLIAQQAGTAAYTLRLNNDLQRSRERLVTAQEEERRRLRRDLHDGVGPTLASLSQRIDTITELVDSQPEKSKQQLKDLKGQVKETVAEIRRLVYALRPPVLDEFGLVSAIREHTAQYSGPNGLQITFNVTEPLPALPAAVEVAAYRIVLEAFTNLVRHANATTCQIEIKLENQNLLLQVSDDGKGLFKENRAGVGFTSMRERAEELGGECAIENSPTGGVVVKARLPLGKE
ncbi:MAG: histidine kinase [Anaerolineales bacterium]